MKKIFLVIHILIALGLLLTGYAGVLSPVKFGIMALAGYAFPFFLLLTLASLVFTTLYHKRHLPIPVLALLAAYQPVTLYVPFHATQEVPDDAITILSYNTHSWGTSDLPEGEPKDGEKVIRYIADSGADIVCLQESSEMYSVQENRKKYLAEKYPYVESESDTSHAQLTVLSRYPIKKVEYIDHSRSGNGSTAYWIDVKGKELIVVNNHLLSTGLSIEQREEFSDMVHGKNRPGRQVSKNIIKQLLTASRQRAPQAEAVASFIRLHRRADGGTPIIVCGDFNDIPQSYTHHVIAASLTDCYQSTARGMGYSFSRYGMRVRIDNVLCTKDITPYNFRVDDGIAASDHYPITGRVKLP